MKKEYIKPYLAVESFQLNAAIAASCSSEGNVPLGRYEKSCVHDETGYFALDLCTWDATGGDGKYEENDKVCYHGPIGMIFVYS